MSIVKIVLAMLICSSTVLLLLDSGLPKVL